MYCRYCGKEIPEGEVCFCESAVNQRIVAQAATAVAEPDAGAKAAGANLNINAILHDVVEAIVTIPKNVVQLFRAPTTLLGTTPSIVFAVCCLLLQMFAGMCIAGGLQSAFGQLINDVAGGYISSGAVRVKGIVGVGAWCGILTYVLTSAYQWLVNWLCRLKNGEKNAPLTAFQSAVSTGVFPSAASLIAGLCFMINVVLGLVVLVVTAFIGVAYFSNMLRSLQKQSIGAHVLMINGLLIAVLVILVNVLDIGILVKFIQNFVEQQTSNILGGLF